METHGEKTEQPTPRRLDEAQKRGQIARSPEVQTVFVLLAAICAFSFAGRESWAQLLGAVRATMAHLHDTPVTVATLHGYALAGAAVFAKCAGPFLIATVLGALIAGGIQTQFTTASEALTPNWQRLNPAEGIKRVLSMRSAAPTALAALKLAVIVGLSYAGVREVLADPVFTTEVGIDRLAGFLAWALLKVLLRIVLVLGLIAAADYGYQFWRTHRDLMMTRQELQDELKSTEGNPLIKRARRRLSGLTKRKMLAEVPNADVVVTNPTFIAIALRYDSRKMKAPRVVAKGIRLNAERIREIAREHQVPIVENKPLARVMFKHCKVGGEVPAELYVAVAEILAWVYRVNRYRYAREAAMAAS